MLVGEAGGARAAERGSVEPQGGSEEVRPPQEGRAGISRTQNGGTPGVCAWWVCWHSVACPRYRAQEPHIYLWAKNPQHLFF